MADEGIKTSSATTNVVAAPPPPAAATSTPPVPAPTVPAPATGRGKASGNAASQNMAATRKLENSSGREYKYFTEISQMMFVFGEVQDPMPETVSLVEDIVRSQIIELVG